MTVGSLLRRDLRDQIAERLAKLTAEQRLLMADWLIGRLPDEGPKC